MYAIYWYYNNYPQLQATILPTYKVDVHPNYTPIFKFTTLPLHFENKVPAWPYGYQYFYWISLTIYVQKQLTKLCTLICFRNMKDLILLTSAVQTMTLVSNYFWLFLLLVSMPFIFICIKASRYILRIWLLKCHFW